MKNLLLISKLDIIESFRSKWFIVYLLIFSGLIAIFFVSGVTNSRVLGFSGLTRLLLLFIQICIVIVPIFILISTVRSISGDRESGLLEYFLSFPLSLKEYYFGKVLGRVFVVFTPLLFALIISVLIGIFKGSKIPWDIFFFYTLLLLALSVVFLSFGFLISSIVKNQEMGQGIAFLVWLVLIAFLDIALIGLMLKSAIRETTIYTIALLNPIELFRIAAISLFDPNLAVIGPAAYFILDKFTPTMFIIYTFGYSIMISILCFFIGYYVFSKKDLV